MGLDMYLKKITYIGADYAHNNVKGKIEITKDGKPLNIDFSKITSIEEKAAYWRKAHHIHAWFVENCQGGVDDCGSYNVDKSQLTALYKLCKKILENKKKAPELLPIDGEEYDEYYFQDIEETMDKIFKAICSAGEYAEFQYQASW